MYGNPVRAYKTVRDERAAGREAAHAYNDGKLDLYRAIMRASVLTPEFCMAYLEARKEG